MCVKLIYFYLTYLLVALHNNDQNKELHNFGICRCPIDFPVSESLYSHFIRIYTKLLLLDYRKFI